MHSEVPSHEKIRFRRDEIACLDQFPSALSCPRPPSRRLFPFRVVKIALWCVAALGLVIVLLVGSLFAGLGNETLRAEAERAIQDMAGEDYVAAVGGTRLSTDGLELLSLEANNVTLSPRQGEEEALHVGTVRLGLRYAALLFGRIEIGQIKMQDSRLVLASLASEDDGANLPFFNAAGLFDPDAAVRLLFAGADEFAGLLHDRDVSQIRLRNVDMVVAPDPAYGTVRIVDARLVRGSGNAFRLEGDIEAAGRAVTVAGDVIRDPQDGLVSALALDVSIPDDGKGGTNEATATHRFDTALLSITGTRDFQSRRVGLNANLAGLALDLRDGDRIVGDVGLRATMLEGAGKIEVDELKLASGRSNWLFHGAFGPSPDEASGNYRFELVSDGSTIAPEGSPERALNVVARLSGTVNADADVIDISSIGVRSLDGEVAGRSRIHVAENGTGVDLELTVSGMPVGEVKQLWPWFSARGARRWVVDNIYGGRVDKGQIRINAAPGRLSRGPLTASELSGEFSIRGTRFDVAGRIPPVRDGNGSVVFAGMNIDIALESGTVFMQGGRTVDARNGLLEIRNANQRPVIGRLKIDVEGKADSILQLASYDPIDVSRFFDMEPDELSGDVKGVIHADIPLERNFPIEKLDWKVDLTYDDLAITRTFEGQKVTKASGTIVVDPGKAEIDASVHLNGVPASVRLVEPLGSSPVERQRNVALNLDDKARQTIAPGLNSLLSGVARVELDDAAGSARAIRASLERAVLSIPWIGWSKGTGVPASVAFALEQKGNVTQLSDFRLSGETFGATGALSLVDGSVQTISFPMAKLNRNDNFSFNMKAERGGYSVSVRGKAVDVRSVVKLYAGGGDSAGEGLGSGPVRIDLKVDSMTGFHGETLSGVTLSYAGTSGRTDFLEFSATTVSGAPVSFTDKRDGGNRTVTMTSTDAGALLRFLDVYEHMEGGALAMTLHGAGNGPLSGQIDVRNFWIVNEPRLRSLVSSTPAGSNRSLNQAVRADIDTTRVQFERAFSLIVKGEGTLDLQRGVVRGPLIGSTFQGRLYDAAGNMDMTGTFMPAYGLNRIFGEIPLIGQLLGNGRDRGLIGITFRLAGKSGEPQLQINPLSVIAPGIFRSVFEYR